MFSDGYFVVNDYSFQVVISDSRNVINREYEIHFYRKRELASQINKGREKLTIVLYFNRGIISIQFAIMPTSGQ